MHVTKGRKFWSVWCTFSVSVWVMHNMAHRYAYSKYSVGSWHCVCIQSDSYSVCKQWLGLYSCTVRSLQWMLAVTCYCAYSQQLSLSCVTFRTSIPLTVSYCHSILQAAIPVLPLQLVTATIFCQMPCQMMVYSTCRLFGHTEQFL